MPSNVKSAGFKDSGNAVAYFSPYIDGHAAEFEYPRSAVLGPLLPQVDIPTGKDIPVTRDVARTLLYRQISSTPYFHMQRTKIRPRENGPDKSGKMYSGTILHASPSASILALAGNDSRIIHAFRDVALGTYDFLSSRTASHHILNSTLMFPEPHASATGVSSLSADAGMHAHLLTPLCEWIPDEDHYVCSTYLQRRFDLQVPTLSNELLSREREAYSACGYSIRNSPHRSSVTPWLQFEDLPAYLVAPFFFGQVSVYRAICRDLPVVGCNELERSACAARLLNGPRNRYPKVPKSPRPLSGPEGLITRHRLYAESLGILHEIDAVVAKSCLSRSEESQTGKSSNRASGTFGSPFSDTTNMFGEFMMDLPIGLKSNAEKELRALVQAQKEGRHQVVTVAFDDFMQAQQFDSDDSNEETLRRDHLARVIALKMGLWTNYHNDDPIPEAGFYFGAKAPTLSVNLGFTPVGGDSLKGRTPDAPMKDTVQPPDLPRPPVRAPRPYRMPPPDIDF